MRNAVILSAAKDLYAMCTNNILISPVTIYPEP